MRDSLDVRFLGRVSACGLLAVALLSGCSYEEGIERYHVAKPELMQNLGPAPAAQGEPQQMLVAMTIVDNTGWFFKLAGTPERVVPQEAKFREFLQSVEFSGPDKTPKWKAPEGWTLGDVGGIRFATLVVDAANPPLEMAVTRLEKSSASDSEYILSNFNRWRTQVQLPEFANEPEVRRAATALDVKGQNFLMANFTGTGAPSGGMGAGPFAGLSNALPPVASGANKSPPGENAPSDLKFTLPEGWTQGAASPPFSFAKFAVQRDGKKLDISVSTAGGTLLANVNRWRDQVGLPAAAEAELQASLKPMSVGSTAGQYVELVGTPAAGGETILGVIAAHDGQTWFVKLKGDSQLAAQEKARFAEFVKSLQLP